MCCTITGGMRRRLCDTRVTGVFHKVRKQSVLTTIVLFDNFLGKYATIDGKYAELRALPLPSSHARSLIEELDARDRRDLFNEKAGSDGKRCVRRSSG